MWVFELDFFYSLEIQSLPPSMPKNWELICLRTFFPSDSNQKSLRHHIIVRKTIWLSHNVMHNHTFFIWPTMLLLTSNFEKEKLAPCLKDLTHTP